MSRGFLSCQFTVRSTDRRPRLDPTAGVRPRRCEGSAPGRAGDKGRVRTSRQRMSRCGALPALVAVTVVSCAAQDQVPRLRTAAHRDRNDVVHLEEEARAAAPPAIPVDEGAAPLIAPPDLSFHRSRNRSARRSAGLLHRSRLPCAAGPPLRYRTAGCHAGLRRRSRLRRSCAPRAPIRNRTAGCHARLRRRSKLRRHRAAGAPAAICTRRNALRRRSAAARRRPERSPGQGSPGATTCRQVGRRSAVCRRLRGAPRCGRGHRRRRGLPGSTRVLRSSRHAIGHLPPRCPRGTLVTGRSGLSPLPARGAARIVALQSLPHQPPHELPDGQVRVHVRQQLP